MRHFHIVEKGDTLYAIAKKYHGFGFLWRMIYERNMEEIGRNPHILHEGDKYLKFYNLQGGIENESKM